MKSKEIEISEETKAIAEHIIKSIRSLNRKLEIQSFIKEFGVFDVFADMWKPHMHILQVSLGMPNGMVHSESGTIKIWRRYPSPWWQLFNLNEPDSLDEIEKYICFLKEEKLKKCQK